MHNLHTNTNTNVILHTNTNDLSNLKIILNKHR
jgi:hypothetical protein